MGDSTGKVGEVLGGEDEEVEELKNEVDVEAGRPLGVDRKVKKVITMTICWLRLQNGV